MKKTFVLYTDLKEKISKLSREDKGALFEAILAFENGEEIPEDMPFAAEIAFDFIRPQLEENEAKYEETKQKRVEAANARWSKEKECTCMQMHTDASECNANDAVTVTDTVTVIKEKDSKESKKKTAFSAPSVEEVDAYCRERGNCVDAEAFVNFYASKGWMVGKSKMKDWKACVRTWEQRNKDSPKKFNVFDWKPPEN